jgi:hypothetical protein
MSLVVNVRYLEENSQNKTTKAFAAFCLFGAVLNPNSKLQSVSKALMPAYLHQINYRSVYPFIN